MSAPATDEQLGRFGHHPEPGIDYECEIDALIGMAYDRLVMGGASDLEDRITKAMAFQVLQRPGELRWLNHVFNGVREIYAIKPAWVEWPEDRIQKIIRERMIGAAKVEAAPDMYDALEAFDHLMVVREAELGALSSEMAAVVRQARAALAKARGESDAMLAERAKGGAE